MGLFFCLCYRKENFGFDIRIGLWQVNDHFQLTFYCDSALKKSIFGYYLKVK